jgi:hypothetical protein
MEKEQTATKRAYRRPQLKNWGTVVQLTQTGLTHPGGDGKVGSATSEGN